MGRLPIAILVTVFFSLVALNSAFAQQQTVPFNQSGTQGVGSSQEFQSSQAKQPVRISQLLGKEIDNANGVMIGKIDDAIITRNGQVPFLIVSPAKEVGIGDNLIPLPFDSVMQFPHSGSVILTNLDQSILRTAPRFARSDWPDFSNSVWQQNVYSYYGSSAAPQSPNAQGQLQAPETQQGSELR